MWNNAHGTLNAHCIHHGINAIRMNIISPAYMFPNNRKPSDIGFEINVINSRTKLTGYKEGYQMAE